MPSNLTELPDPFQDGGTDEGVPLEEINVSALFSCHYRHLLRFVLRYVRNPDDAEDVVQNTFVECMRCAHQFGGRSKPSTWLFGIAYNMARNHLRTQYNNPCDGTDTDFDEFESATPDPAQLTETQELLARVTEVWDALSPKLRSAYEAVVADGSSYEEVAESLHIPLGTVRSRVARVREKMRELT